MIMRRIICLILCVGLSFTVVGCKARAEKYTHTCFDYFDTVTSVVGFAESENAFKANCKRIEEKLEEYHKLYTIYSRYEGLNNLNSVNAVNDGKHTPVKVDGKIIEMLEFAKEIYTLTNAKTNVAMGSVLSIWHDYRNEGIKNPSAAKLPPKDELKAASRHTSIDDVIINRENSTVYLKDGEMSLDVGAVAKGYATEEIALWMESQGMSGYLLNVGGNIRVVGKRPDGEKWQIGIENPDKLSSQAYIEYLELDSMSLVTSGSYQRYYQVDGKQYHHIINPDTLMPATGYRSVSVLCESSGLADALSTALFSMSVEEGKKTIEKSPNTYVMWVTDSGEQIYSKGFKKFTKE